MMEDCQQHQQTVVVFPCFTLLMHLKNNKNELC